MTLSNTVEVVSMLEDEDLTKIFLAQQGDEQSMLYLVQKYSAAIYSAANRYREEYGAEDCVAEARCAFIERVHNADPSNLKKFRTALVKELADVVATRLNPYGLTRRQMDNVRDELFVTVPDTGLNDKPELGRTIDRLPTYLQVELWINLDDEELLAVETWLEYPRMTEEQVAEEAGMSRSTFQRRLATAFAKLREALGGQDV
jgi:RNA polymerase sigma factor (sigma-70 family)